MLRRGNRQMNAPLHKIATIGSRVGLIIVLASTALGLLASVILSVYAYVACLSEVVDAEALVWSLSAILRSVILSLEVGSVGVVILLASKWVLLRKMEPSEVSQPEDEDEEEVISISESGPVSA